MMRISDIVGPSVELVIPFARKAHRGIDSFDVGSQPVQFQLDYGINGLVVFLRNGKGKLGIIRLPINGSSRQNLCLADLLP